MPSSSSSAKANKVAQAIPTPQDVPDSLKSDPVMMMLASRLVERGDSSIYQALAGAKTPDEFKKVLVRYHLTQEMGGEAVDTIFQGGTLEEITNSLASVLSGKVTPRELRSMVARAQETGKAQVETSYIDGLKTSLKTDSRYHQRVRGESAKAVLKNLGIGTGLVTLIAVAYMAFSAVIPGVFETRRRDALQPMYQQIVQAIPAQTPAQLKDMITIGVDTPFTPLDYTAYNSIPDAAKAYTTAKDMPETSGEFGTDVSKELLDKKIAAYDSIIAAYPGSLESYMSQYEIYVLKSFNQKLYTADDIVGEMDSLVTGYSNAKVLSTKKLVELVGDYMTLKGPDETVAWLNRMIKQTTGSNAEFKLDYVLASIYAGQTKLISISSEDKLSIIALPDALVQKKSGSVGPSVIEDLYAASSHGNALRASIGHYSLALYELRAIDLNAKMSDSVLLSQRSTLLDAASNLEEAAALTSDAKDYERFWVADDLYRLAQVANQLGLYDDAKAELSYLAASFPNDTLVQTKKVEELTKAIDATLGTIAADKQKNEQARFEQWFTNLEDQVMNK